MRNRRYVYPTDRQNYLLFTEKKRNMTASPRLKLLSHRKMNNSVDTLFVLSTNDQLTGLKAVNVRKDYKQ